MKKIILAGGGGHALSLLEALPELENIEGYFALQPSEAMPVRWLGTDDSLPEWLESNLFHIAFVYSGLPLMNKRRNMIDYFEGRGAIFESIIAPSAVITRNAKVAEGCAVLNNAVINRATLGRHVIVNTGAIVEHDCIVGKNTFIGPGAVIGGNVHIGENCFIGLGAKVKNNVTIADGVSVGMGCVIDRDLTEPGVYHGHAPLKYHRLRH